MKKKVTVICVMCLAAVLAFAACGSPAVSPGVSPSATASAETTATPAESASASASLTPVNLSGNWTDPLTSDVLSMSNGKFTIKDANGDTLSEGTYKAGETQDTYDVTYADGTTGSFKVDNLAVEFTNSDGAVTVYESSTVE